jgi:hypothetical protein
MYSRSTHMQRWKAPSEVAAGRAYNSGSSFRTKKTVQFGLEVQVEIVEIEHLDDILDASAIWWTARETAEIRDESETVLFILESANQSLSEEEHSIRGLEKKTEAGAWELFVVQRDSRNAVLNEQEHLIKQSKARKDVKDADECIARAYKMVTLKARKAAREMGLRDEQVALQYLNGEDFSVGLGPKLPTEEESKSTSEQKEPIKYPQRNRKWDRKISMPLMDPVHEKANNGPTNSSVAHPEGRVKERAHQGTQSPSNMTAAIITSSSCCKKAKAATSETAKDIAEKTKALVKTLEPVRRQASVKARAQIKKEKEELQKAIARKEAVKARETARRMSQGLAPEKTTPQQPKKNKAVAESVTPTTLDNVVQLRSNLEANLAKLAQNGIAVAPSTKPVAARTREKQLVPKKKTTATESVSPVKPAKAVPLSSNLEDNLAKLATARRSAKNKLGVVLKKDSDGECWSAASTELNDSCDDNSSTETMVPTSSVKQNPAPPGQTKTQSMMGFLNRFRRKSKRQRGGRVHQDMGDEGSIVSDAPSVAGSCCF